MNLNQNINEAKFPSESQFNISTSCVKHSTGETETSETKEKCTESSNKNIQFNFKKQQNSEFVRFPINGRIKKITKPKQGKIEQNEKENKAKKIRLFPNQEIMVMLKNSVLPIPCKKSFQKNGDVRSNQKTTKIAPQSLQKNKETTLLNNNRFGNAFSSFQLSEMLRSFDRTYFFEMVEQDYLSQRQTQMTQKSRAMLINWLLLINQKFNFSYQTFFTAVNVLDIYCSRVNVVEAHFQLLGLTSLHIAAKFEEIHPPKLIKFLSISENAISVQDLIKLEADILTTINFRISTYSPFQLLEILVAFYKIDTFTFLVARGFLVSSCFDLRMYKFGCESIVHCCISLAKKITQNLSERGNENQLLDSLNFYSTSIMAGERETLCMQYLSFIVMNLEKAGLVAIRKAFPSFERKSHSNIVESN